VSIIEFKNVSKAYVENYREEDLVINDLTLSIEAGEFVTFIGESGCGKTTLLKMINGLVLPSDGTISIMDKTIKEWDLIKLRRHIGYVIQQIGLFPHLTIAQNISFVLDIMDKSEEEKLEKSRELIQLVGLPEDYLDKYPAALSGGQKQRVGVARALAADPDILLMDEPFGAVDEITRKVLQTEILKIQSKLKKTIIFVTHDIEEALKLGHKIVLFNKGKIEQIGTKEEMVFRPASSYVEDFFGYKNFLAYMSVMKIQDFYEERPVLENTHGMSTLSADATLVEGIKKLYDLGLQEIPVSGFGATEEVFSIPKLKTLIDQKL
jgi:osmoprotectant transport system ATP-binding protein